MIRRMFGASRGIGRVDCAPARRTRTPPADAASSVNTLRLVIMRGESLGGGKTAPNKRAQCADVEWFGQEGADPFVDRRGQLRSSVRADDDDGDREEVRLVRPLFQHIPS